MPIPQRLRPPPISEADIAAWSEICNIIESGLHAGQDVSALLDQWNRRACRRYEDTEFMAYYEGVDIHTFVKEALLPAPHFVDDLTYDELKQVLAAVVAIEVDQAELCYYLWWLEENLPRSTICNLIFHPDHWFNDRDKRHVDLTEDQILAYAMRKSGRMVAGAPQHVSLPFPMPST
jgi:hypothetical protein